MTSKLLVNENDKLEVKEVLRKFQEGYTNRNVEILDNYINELFINNNKVITVGTSRTEWCFGLDDLKGLLESDWKYWGDFVIDYENARINSKDNIAWFVADCTTTWSSPEDYNEWCDDLIGDYYEEDGRYINYKTESKIAMLNLKLAFIVKSIYGNKGSNIPFPVRLSGGLIKKNGKWLINKLHFSAPMSSYPEWRIDKDNDDSLKYYYEIKEKIRDFSGKYLSESKDAIVDFLNEFKVNYLNKTINTKDTVNNLFLSFDDIYVVDPNEIPAAIGSENIENIISLQREKWDDMVLNTDEAIVNTIGDTATITTTGIFKKVLSSDELLLKEWSNIKKTLQENGKGEEKLFAAQKQIAYAFKELSFGEESLWEFRFEALVIKEDNKWKFHNIQFSYPLLYVFEGNYNMTPLL